MAQARPIGSREAQQRFATVVYGTAVSCVEELDNLRPFVSERNPQPITDDGGKRADAFAATMLAWVELRRLKSKDEARWWNLVQVARRSYRPDAPPCKFCDLQGSPTMLENVEKMWGLRLRQLVYTIGRSDPLDLKDLGRMRTRLAEDWRETDPEGRTAVLTILAATFREPEDVAIQLVREAASTGLISLGASAKASPGAESNESKRRKRPRGSGRVRAPTEIEVETLMTLERFGHNKSQAALALGVDRTTVAKNAKRAREVIARAGAQKSRSVKTSRLPSDRRGQELAEDNSDR